MNHHLILMAHILFGVMCAIGSLWVFVETWHVTEANLGRIRKVSLAVAIVMWLAYGIAGHWYMTYYGAEKAIILQGPWPVAHHWFMETKEHLVIMLLLLVTYLPIAASSNVASNRAARTMVLWTSGLVFSLALVADGFGAIVGMGVKTALLAR